MGKLSVESLWKLSFESMEKLSFEYVRKLSFYMVEGKLSFKIFRSCDEIKFWRWFVDTCARKCYLVEAFADVLLKDIK